MTIAAWGARVRQVFQISIVLWLMILCLMLAVAHGYIF